MSNTKNHFLNNPFDKTKVKPLGDMILKKPKELKQFFEVFKTGDVYCCQRAGWVLEYLSKKDESILYPHISWLTKELKKEHSSAFHRNTLRSLQFLTIPEKNMGDLIEITFGIINDPKRDTAHRAFALNIAKKMVKNIPEIKNELTLIVEENQYTGTVGFKSLCRKYLDNY